jgi:hypothetical protein
MEALEQDLGPLRAEAVGLDADGAVTVSCSHGDLRQGEGLDGEQSQHAHENIWGVLGFDQKGVAEVWLMHGCRL